MRVRGRVFLYLRDYITLKVNRRAAEDILREAGCPERVLELRWYPAEILHTAFDLYIYEYESGDTSQAEQAGKYFFYRFLEEKPWEMAFVANPFRENFLRRLWFSFYRGKAALKYFRGGAALEVASEDFGLAPTYAMAGWLNAMAEHLGIRLAAVTLRERLVEFVISW